MAGFRKAKPQQTAVKIGLYGPAGSGKTFTSLLLAEGLAEQIGKRVAMVDTEHGSDFYSIAVPDRTVHPEEFDFDALYTRSVMEVLREVQKLDEKKYGVLVLDSITHIWESCIDSYGGAKTSAGTIPFHAWSKIKRPYKQLMTFLLNSPMHVLICGRQRNEYGEDEDTGEVKMIGVGMKAEGETPYEPHVLIRMNRERSRKGQSPVSAFVEKDRSGTIAGRLILLPPDQPAGFTFEQIGLPLLSVLSGESQAKMQTKDEVAAADSEAIADEDLERDAKSADLREHYEAKFKLASGISADEVEKVSKELTKDVKAQMLPRDVSLLRECYTESLRKVKKAS